MITVAREGALCVITLNRPDKANAITPAMLADLCDAVDDAAGAQALILTGVGKVFCAGADLEAARAGLAVSPLWARLSNAVAAHRGLSVAALNGTAAGGSLGMVMACDLRVAVPGAQMFYPVMRLGFRPPAPDPGRMSALIGPARTKMILMAGQKVSAPEAMAWGLIDRLADDPVAEARALCADALAAGAEHAAAIKEMIPPR